MESESIKIALLSLRQHVLLGQAIEEYSSCAEQSSGGSRLLFIPQFAWLSIPLEESRSTSTPRGAHKMKLRHGS